jgi:spore germination cell wall hydrolase CwlJ-like protein
MFKILTLSIAIAIAMVMYPVKIVHQIADAKVNTKQLLLKPRVENITLKQHLESPIINLVPRQTTWKERIYPQDEISCLAHNIYFEAAIESTAGKLAVAFVTHNRVLDNNFPNSYCKVIYEAALQLNGFPKRDQCQFSWFCDGKHDIPYPGKNWTHIQGLAKWFYKSTIINNYVLRDITDGATHYHADYIDNPRWSKFKKRTVQIDRHIFYR